MAQIVRNVISDKSYEIVKKLGETKRFNLYLCTCSKKAYILKIASKPEFNILLALEASILADMRSHAAFLEDAYTKIKTDPNVLLNYQLCFPDIHDSFVSDKQKGRHLNIIGFNAVEDVGNLVPVRHITTRDQVRVDCKTSAWMLGKLLKFIAFAHNQKMSCGRMTGDNVLIEREQHFILYFDMTRASYHGDEVPQDIRKTEIMKAAGIITMALGGDSTTGEYFADEQDPEGKYASFVYHLVCGGESDANKAHSDFYTLVELLWPRTFWPYTTFPLEG